MKLKMQPAASLKLIRTTEHASTEKKCPQCFVFMSSIFPVLPSPLFSPLPLCLLDLLDPLLGALSPPSDSSGSVIGWLRGGAGLTGCLCCFSGWRLSPAVSFGNSHTTSTTETYVALKTFLSSFYSYMSSVLVHEQTRRLSSPNVEFYYLSFVRETKGE